MRSSITPTDVRRTHRADDLTAILDAQEHRPPNRRAPDREMQRVIYAICRKPGEVLVSPADLRELAALALDLSTAENLGTLWPCWRRGR